MRQTLIAVTLLATGSVALAQTPGTTPPNGAGRGSTTMTPGTNAAPGMANTAPSTSNNGAPGAQTPSAAVNTNPSSTTNSPSAVQTRNTTQRTRNAPVPGANSFTMAQARNRIASAGYSNVTGLKKDAKGVWRGQAQKDGNTVPVALDYQGNVTSGDQPQQ